MILEWRRHAYCLMESIVVIVLEISRDSCWRLVSANTICTQAGTAYVHRT